ncbi:MAG TPA: LysR family transcriptional regulator [Sphingomonas sp.]|jgi:DNA-binding transcriptional LysR family regulator|nr:LysR family transcriptional regulator [Sphingomonas sp.]
MKFKGLDLNLLGVFAILLETRSVSRSAEQLNLSQPAISSALRRLRDYFGDDILVVHGKRMFPTPYAETLLPQVKEALRAVDTLIATSNAFDPATSQRTFKICSSDYMAAAVLAPLARRFADEAPGVRLELLLNDGQSLHQLEQGLIDIIITPEDYIGRHMPAEFLLDEDHVVVGWTGNPLFPDKMDEAAFLAAGHIQVAIGHQRTSVFSDRQIEMLGKHRRVEVVASSFAVVPWLVIGTQRLTVMHKRLATAMAGHYPIALAPLPFPIPVMREMVQYHSARVADPGLSWLRQRLREQGDHA